MRNTTKRMPTLVTFSSKSRTRSTSLDSQESANRQPCQEVFSESCSTLDDDRGGETFVHETHSDEFSAPPTTKVSRRRAVRFANERTTNQYYVDLPYTAEECAQTWYTKQEVAAFKRAMREHADQAAQDTLWVNVSLKAYVACCTSKKVDDVRKLVKPTPSPLDDNHYRTTRLGLEMLALPSLANDRRIRQAQIYARVQQLQINCLSATAGAQRISMASRSLSRPSRLFAFYTAAAAANNLEF